MREPQGYGEPSAATWPHPTTIFLPRARNRALPRARARARARNRIMDKTYYSATRYTNIQMNLQIKF